MTENMKLLSLRQFRERAAEIREKVEIAVRDSGGNLRVLGFYTPYTPHPPGAVESPTERVEVEVIEVVGAGQPRIIRTPEEAAAAVSNPVRAFPKSAQTGRKKR